MTPLRGRLRRPLMVVAIAAALLVGGIAGLQTWGALIVEVKSGSTGSAVKAAQERLNWQGAGLAVDGGFVGPPGA